MAVSLAALLVPVTETQALDLALDTLESLGFNVTGWHDGSKARTLVQLGAKLYSSVTSSVALIAAAGFNALASGAWLDVLSEDFYGNIRVAALPTQGQFRLTASAAAPPVVIAAGDLQIADAATTPANTFRNTSGGALNPGGTLDITVEAETAGVAGNIPNLATLYMWTSLVGVTATNPVIGATTTWITRAGADAETDTRLRARNTAKWSTLSYAAVDGAYKAWALAADATVTRVKVRANNPYGPGTVDVVCATGTGGISAAQATAILAYINGSGTTGRRPLGDVVTVQSATTLAQAIAGTVTVSATYQTVTTSAVIQAAIKAVMNAMEIGGTVVPPAATGVLVHSKLVKAVEALTGVISCVISTPAADVALTELQVFDSTAITFAGLSVVYG